MDALSAGAVRVGDTIRMRTGDVVAMAVFTSHGGVECVVRPARGEKPRSLWFWAGQVVRVVARSEGTGEPGEAIGPRPARGAASRAGKAGR